MKPSLSLVAFSLCLCAVKSHAVDADADGMDDIWQSLHGIAPFDGAADPDGDGRINLVEALNFSDPHAPDAGMGWVFITDADPADGMDDLWQMRHGITSAQAFEDPDGDGRTNLEESIVGSHPLQADNPWGAHSGAPVPEGPGSFSVGLAQTAPGLRYHLEWSDDLFNWQPATGFTNPFWGTGAAHSRTLDTGGAPWMFFRYRMDNPDGDGDGLTDWAEGILGTDPQLADSDGDGYDDLDEIDAGTDPNAAASNPLLEARSRWEETGDVEQPTGIHSHGKRIIDYNSAHTSPLTGLAHYFAYTHGDDSTGFYNGAQYDAQGPMWPLFWPELSYPDDPRDLTYFWSIHTHAKAKMRTYSAQVGDTVNDVEINHVRHVLASPAPQPWDVTRKYLRVRKLTVNEGPSVHSTHGFASFTIRKGERASDEFELVEPAPVADQTTEIAHVNISFLRTGFGRLGYDPLVWPPWLMIPQDEPSRLFFRHLGQLSGPIIYFLQTEGGNVQPNLQSMLWSGSGFANNSDRFDFTSSTVGDNGVAKISVGGPYEDEPVLRFAVYPRRTLKVTVHPITLLYPNGTVRSAPQHVPTAEYMEQRLDEILGRQANVFSEVTVSSGAALNWDVGIGMNQNLTGEGNGSLDICHLSNDLVFSQEEQDIMTMVSDSSANVNVYWVAAPTNGIAPGLVLFTRLPNPSVRWVRDRRVPGALGFAGKAVPENGGTLWVWDYPLTYTDPFTGLELSNPDWVWTMAHEIVHYIGNTAHSQDLLNLQFQPNPSYVPNSDSEMRLMTGRAGPKRLTHPMTLVKGEWDSIQNFFNQ